MAPGAIPALGVSSIGDLLAIYWRSIGDPIGDPIGDAIGDLLFVEFCVFRIKKGKLFFLL